MASKTSASGGDTPKNPPAEPKANDNNVAPNNPINNMYKQSKPDINSAHKAALPSNQPLTLRKAPQNDTVVAPNNPINNMYKQSKPDINSAHKAALPSNQPLTLRKAPQNANKPSAASGHKRNKSDDSTSSMQVFLSDRDDDPSPEHIPDPEPRSVREGAEDTVGIGFVFPR